MRHHLPLAFLVGVVFSGCIKITDLDKSNPRDVNYTGKDNCEMDFYSYSIVSDDNADGIINSGENISLNVYVKNIGASIGKDVTASINCSNGYISALTPSNAVSYRESSTSTTSYIKPDAISLSGNSPYTTVNFHVSNITPAGVKITFNMAINEGSKSWVRPFYITVQ